MLLRQIVFVMVRFQAVLSWVSCVTSITSQLALYRQFPEGQGFPFYFVVVMPLFQLIMGCCLWFLAQPLSRLVCSESLSEASVPVSGLTLRDLYAVAFVYLGLSFFGRSLAEAFNWICYNYNPDAWRYYRADDFRRSVYSLLQSAIPLLLSGALFWKAGVLADWLARRDGSRA